jgi:hypothetical protein
MADQYHIDSNIVTTSDSIEPMAGLVVNTTMTDSQSVISNVTTGGVGAKGDKGEQGIPGATGATGATGPKGDKGADSTVPGPQGPQGPQGVQGTAGTNGTNGAKGDKGDTGATGLKGDKGDTGLTGAAGTNGQGVPTGGTTGQQLAKINGTDYNTQWVNPVDISGKQDTLVSGTSIKTVNSTSLLGSGDIVIGGAVDSVNTQTGAVVLDTDDIAEGTNKYVTSAEKTILSNTSGVNTGDQDISGIATNASDITSKVSKAGDTMTGKLTISSGGTYINGNVDLRGATGGYLNVYDIVYGNGYYSEGPIYPTGNRVYNLGTSAKYWNNSYTNRLYLNSTAYLDGSVAGIVNISGGIKVTNSSTFSSPITVNSLSTGTAIDIRTPLNAFGESIYMTIQTRARIGYDGTGLVLDDNNTNKRVRISSNSRSWDFSTAGSFVAPGDMEITDTTKGSNKLRNLPRLDRGLRRNSRGLRNV